MALALITVGSVGNLGSDPPLAVLGLASVFLYVLPALVFLLPITLVAAELASGWPGGVFNWVEQGISPPMGLLAIWCQFAQTFFFYPALLAYVADTLAYAIDPHLAGNGVYTAAIIIVLFWGGVLVASRGVPFVAGLAAGGTVIGTLILAAIIVALGAVYLLHGNHPDAPITVHQLLPPWHGLASIVLVISSFFTYAGIEVNAVHVNDLRNPAREYPRAIFVAMGLVTVIRLGLRLTVSGGREAATRLVVLAAAVGIGVGLLLTAVSAVNAVGAQNDRYAWLDTGAKNLLQTSPRGRPGVPAAPAAAGSAASRDPLWGLVTTDEPRRTNWRTATPGTRRVSSATRDCRPPSHWSSSSAVPPRRCRTCPAPGR